VVKMAEEEKFTDGEITEEERVTVPHVAPDLLLFGKWDSTEVEIKDPGLVKYISLRPVLIPHTSGRHAHRRVSR